MPISPTAASKNVVRESLDEGLEWLLNEGHETVSGRYLPALQVVDGSARTAADKKLAARGWYLLGELRQLLDAPRASIRAYEHCLRHAPGSPEPWAEIGRMHTALGRSRDAAHAVSEAKRLAPGHVDELDDMMFWEEARYREGSPVLEAAEALAEGDGERALSLLGGRATVDVRRWRACAHGVRGDLDALTDEWRAITRGRGGVFIGYADWYYLPVAVWGRADFWEALQALGDRLDEEAIFPIDGALSRARGLSEAQKGHLTFTRRAAEARRDREALADLIRARPRWTEAKESLAEMDGGKRPKR